jgi:eIF4-gamma/eIF5/eIF2-epsilon
VKALYQLDILGEDTINFWYKKGSVTRGRNVFLNDIQPFIKWLEEAEEDEDEEEEK